MSCNLCRCDLFVAAFASLGVGVVGFLASQMILANASLFDLCWVQLFMESLILAQDERWRRA